MISSGTIVRGALTRTFPAALAMFAPIIALAVAAGTVPSPARLALALTASLSVAAGSAAALLALRRRLAADAGVTGRRAFIVGITAMAVGWTVRPFLSNAGAAGEHLMIAACGAGLAVAMFSPWLTSGRTTSRAPLYSGK